MPDLDRELRHWPFVSQQNPDWLYPFPPMAGAEGDHTHPVDEVSHETTHALENVAEEIEEAAHDIVDATEHAPEGAAEIPHDLHAELVHLHTRHSDHERRMDGIETQLRDLANHAVFHEVQHAAEEIPEKAAEAEAEALEMPEEVIKPRKIHPFHRFPRWL